MEDKYKETSRAINLAEQFVRASKKNAREFLVKAGILTEHGNIKYSYSNEVRNDK